MHLNPSMMMVHLVPRFRNRALSPINSIKHVIDTEGTITGAAANLVPICVAVPNVDTTTFKPGDVRVGAKVNGFFLSIFAIGSTGAPVSSSINWYIIKIHEGQVNILPTPGQTGTSKIRNQVFHEEKGLAGSGDGTPMAFKGVVAVPRGMRRMREGDQFQILLKHGNDTDESAFCLKAIYKSYF